MDGASRVFVVRLFCVTPVFGMRFIRSVGERDDLSGVYVCVLMVSCWTQFPMKGFKCFMEMDNYIAYCYLSMAEAHVIGAILMDSF